VQALWWRDEEPGDDARYGSSYYGALIADNKPTAYGVHQPWTNCGYTPSQMRGAYGVTASGHTGQGQTVAIVDAYASPTIKSDANQFAQHVGDSAFSTGQFKQYQAGPYSLAGPHQCDAQGWYGEETLDVEAVHGMAPDAGVRYVAAGSCLDSDLAQADALIVNTQMASIVSNSWGEPAQYSTISQVFDSIFQFGALEGIGFFFSSGDSGYEAPGEDPFSTQRQVDYPTSSPYVTSVGGTSLATALPNGTTSSHPMRVVPDVSALADPSTGMLVGQTTLQPDGKTYAFSLSRIGGTSVACPVFAGIEADAQQGLGKPIGFANPAIYYLDTHSPYGSSSPAYNDVTDHPLGPGHLAEVRSNYTNPYTKQGPLLTYLRTLGLNGVGQDRLGAVAGYDDATGVGSPSHYIQDVSALPQQ
jgi:subtilase family serine protease